MNNTLNITIWESCDLIVSAAIQKFEERWPPYSMRSRRYPILRLIREVIDPAITTYMKNLPLSYMGYVPGAGTGVEFSEIIKIMGFDAMARVQRQLLRQFIMTKDCHSPDDQCFIATLESLIELVWGCACKRPKKSSSTMGITLNSQRKLGFCEFCGNHTEFAAFMATVSDDRINDTELDEHKKLELSHRYCSGHRPKLTNGQWNSAYKQAKRALTQFNIELTRLNLQCTKRYKPSANSGDELVDIYFFQFMLSQTLQPADKIQLRNIARRMVDSKLSDTKKKILVLKHQGFNQSEIAQRLIKYQQLPMKRQAVSKSLASVRKEFHLE